MQLVCIAAVCALCGCATTRSLTRPEWIADYDKAERKHQETGGEMLIWYQEARPGIPDPLRDAFDTPELRERIKGYLRCSLLRSYEPDRRYVGQFGVERAPAVIVIHEDGTYHARSGRMSAEEIAQLLDEAQPPGARPLPSPYLHREPYYEWLDNFEQAQAAAEAEDRGIVLVLYRWLTSDWQHLEEIFEQRAVFRRFDETVPCRLSSVDGEADALKERFGITQLPAIVLVHRDGSHDVLELPTSYEAVVRFADEARGGEASPMPPASAGS